MLFWLICQLVVVEAVAPGKEIEEQIRQTRNRNLDWRVGELIGPNTRETFIVQCSVLPRRMTLLSGSIITRPAHRDAKSALSGKSSSSSSGSSISYSQCIL